MAMGRPGAILDAARAAAAITTQYSSVKTRQEISVSFENAFGQTPYGWQVDICEALLLGLDCIAIAGTGAGKTMPFAPSTSRR